MDEKPKNPLVFDYEYQAKQRLTEHRSKPFVKMLIPELLAAARVEREGIGYATEIKTGGYYKETSYGGSSVGNDEREWVEEKRTQSSELLEGSQSNKRYREVCETLAARLIYCTPPELKEFKENCTSDPTAQQTQKDVYKILKDKYRNSVDDLMQLSKHYPEEGNKKEKDDRKKFVEPLGLALGTGITQKAIEHTVSHIDNINGDQALGHLREYAENLLEGHNDRPSIATQLKDTGDPMIQKVLKGMVLTLVTGLAYGIYAIAQAVTGEASYKWIDNPGERLAKNAEKILSFGELSSKEPPHYQSMQHGRGVKGSEKTDELAKKNGETPTSTPTFKG